MVSIKRHPEGLVIKVYVQPRSSINIIAGLHGDALKIRLTAPPLEGEANKLCVKYLAKTLGLSKSCVEIVSGKTSRTKQVLIRPKSGQTDEKTLKNLKIRVEALTEPKQSP